MQATGAFRRARISTARMLAVAATGAAVILTLGAAAPAAAGPRAGTGTITKYPYQLNAVSAVSSSDAWAVGNSGSPLHWNGTSWSPVTIPGLPANASFSAVDALSPSDAWTAGFSYAGAGSPAKTLIVHWDGTSWKRVPSPGSFDTNLIPALPSLSMDSATDGWAVGSVYNKLTNSSRSLALHWNGTSWQRVTTSPRFFFAAVASFSPADATTVGSVRTGTSTYTAAAFHWNGTSWTRTATLPTPPGVSATTAEASALSAQSATDMWAIGYYTGPDAGNLAWHWNGTRWTVTTTPAGLTVGGLQGVAAISPTDAWAVGDDLTAQGGANTLTLHWDGTNWTQVPAPDSPARIVAPPTNPPQSVLTGVSAVSASDVWAVGYHQNDIGNRYTLILHWNGTTWTQF